MSENATTTREKKKETPNPLEQGIMDRYAEISRKQMKERYTDAQVRDFEFLAVMAKIEEQTDISRELKIELEYHYMRFKEHNT